jgi:flavin-dependent dehydrogenase
MPRVTIIGAGIAGLTAALRLAEHGYDVVMFEQDGFVGGKFRSSAGANSGRNNLRGAVSQFRRSLDQSRQRRHRRQRSGTYLGSAPSWKSNCG